MYDGNQVLRFDNKYKSKDLGGLSAELLKRIGTGNYDKDRTKFNVRYVEFDKPNLASKVYSTLKENNVYYNNGKNTNLLNGAMVSSGPEFFQSLGMKFKKTNRVYKAGKKKGKTILVPDIKSEKDIPIKVKQFFDDSYKFLENLVGKENVVFADVHYDEDTPHMQFYFLPVVNEVKRKQFETDDNGNIIKHVITDKDGNDKLVPVQKKDKDGNIIYSIEKGKFLNCDQFWKDRGGKMSFAKIQDEYNKYITEKGFNLYRGNIGSNVHHKTKAEKEIEDLNEQLNDIKLELLKNEILNQNMMKTNDEIESIDSKEILNPIKRKLVGYSDKDVEKLINYSKKIQRDNANKKGMIEKKNILLNDMNEKIKKLSTENSDLKDNTAYKQFQELVNEQLNTINKQDKIIKEKNKIIKELEGNIKKLDELFKRFKEEMYKACRKISKAMYRLMGHHNIKEETIDINLALNDADKINRKNEKSKSNDYDLSR